MFGWIISHIFQPVSLLDMVHDGSCFIGSPFFKINFTLFPQHYNLMFFIST
ncbi:hypothetical protein M095_3508 [Parabacteroides distasonis str. 3999B T(B) 4]|nr:hypothetical protein M095_3508 [Parabacteroides distasonis str. 3999B T(B) 4]